MAERVRVREVDDDEGRRLLRIIRRGTGSVVTWRRAQTVLLSAQAMPVAKIVEVTFTSADRVRDVIHDFNADGFDSLYPKYKGGRPSDLHAARAAGDQEDRQVQAGRVRPAVLDLEPGQAGGLPGRRGVVDDISHEGLRVLLREEGVSFQRVKTWKASRDPGYAAKKDRVEHLYAIADGEVIPEDGEPEAVFCLDEFGPLSLQPHPGRQWAEHGGRHKNPDREPRPRRRATCTRPHGVRHLFAAYDLSKDQLYGHIKKTKNRSKFLEFCRYLRSLHPADVRIAIVCDNYSPPPDDEAVPAGRDLGGGEQRRDRLHPDQQLLAQPDRGPVHRPALLRPRRHRHASHKVQGSMIRRYIIWRNKHAADERLRKVVARANVA